MRPKGSAHIHIEWLATTDELLLGSRLEALRSIISAAQKAERKLLTQMGIDLAKQLFAMGIEPQGRKIGDILRERDEAA